MQDYPDILATDSVGGSRSNLLARDNAVKSCFAGTAYPGTGLLQGMMCYRTDLNKLYTLEQVSPAIWREVILSSAVGTAAGKNIGTSGDTIPKNDTANTFSAQQTFAAGVALANQSITGNSGSITIDTDVRLNANNTKKVNFLINNTSAMSVESDRGVVIGGPTGGSKGAGTLNAVDIYKNGNQIKTAAYKDTGTSGDTVPTWNNLGNAAALNLASNSEALAGTANDKIMTPLRVAEAIGANAVGGKLLATRIYNTAGAGTYSKNASARYIRVRLWGGTGAGGGATAGGSGTPYSCGGSGGGAGYSEKVIDNASINSSESYTVGAAGSTSGFGTNGGNGGTSSFGTTPYLSATGGQGGKGTNSDPLGGTPGAGSGGDLNLTGQSGQTGMEQSANISITTGDTLGGSSPFGVSWGGKGGRAVGNGSQVVGGAAMAGLIIVEEYA